MSHSLNANQQYALRQIARFGTDASVVTNASRTTVRTLVARGLVRRVDRAFGNRGGGYELTDDGRAWIEAHP